MSSKMCKNKQFLAQRIESIRRAQVELLFFISLYTCTRGDPRSNSSSLLSLIVTEGDIPLHALIETTKPRPRVIAGVPQ